MNKEPKRRGAKRKESGDIRKPFVFSIYLSDNEVQKIGGRDKVFDKVAETRKELQTHFENILCG